MSNQKNVRFAEGTKKNDSSQAQSEADKNKRLAELEIKVRLRKDCEERAHRIVERLIENPISEEFLKGASQFIHPSHYVDVTEERAIARLCGYPLCTKPLPKQPKQKFHISLAHKTVYDITERKNFCSNQCFKSSKYFERQISTSAVWARKEEPPVSFCVLPLDTKVNRGKVGKEVMTDPSESIRLELKALEEMDKCSSTQTDKSDTVNDEVEVGLDQLAEDVADLMLIEKTAEGTEHKDARNSETDANLDGVGDKSQAETLESGLVHSRIDEDSRADADGDEPKPPGGGNVDTGHPTPPGGSNADREGPTTPGGGYAESDGPMSPGGRIQVPGVSRTVDPRSNDPMVPVQRPSPVAQGARETSDLVSTINRKSKLLSDLLDKRDRLLQVKDGATHQSESDTVRAPTTVNKPATSEGTVATSKPSVASAPRVSRDSVIDNIRRVANQQKAHQETRSKRRSKKSTSLSAIVPIRNTLLEWRTADTTSYLSGVGAEEEESGMTDFDQKYARLGQRVANLDLSGVLGEETLEDARSSARPLPDINQLQRDKVQLELKVKEFYRGNMRYPVLDPDDDVQSDPRAATDDTHAADQHQSGAETQREPVMPHVDTHSQTAIRRKIVFDQLYRVMPDLLRPLRLLLQDVGSELRHLVNTFSFTATNIILKSAEWILMAYFLLRLLALKTEVVKEAFDKPSAAAFFTPMLAGLGITEPMIQEVLKDVTSHSS